LVILACPAHLHMLPVRLHNIAFGGSSRFLPYPNRDRRPHIARIRQALARYPRTFLVAVTRRDVQTTTRHPCLQPPKRLSCSMRLRQSGRRPMVIPRSRAFASFSPFLVRTLRASPQAKKESWLWPVEGARASYWRKKTVRINAKEQDGIAFRREGCPKEERATDECRSISFILLLLIYPTRLLHMYIHHAFTFPLGSNIFLWPH